MKKNIKSITIVLIVAVLLIWGFVVYLLIQKGDKKVVSITKITGEAADSGIKNSASDNQKVEEATNKQLEKPNFYSYNGKTLSFDEQKPGVPGNVESAENNYPIYLSKGVGKAVFIKDFHPYCPVCEAKFEKTIDPNIPVLLSGGGDLGFSFTDMMFINLNSEKYLTVGFSFDSGNPGLIEVTSPSGVKSVIKMLVDDNCKKNKSALLEDILVDDIPRNVFAFPLELNCSFDGEFGPNYIAELNFSAVNRDWSKVFFYVSGSNANGNFRHNYSFNINDKIIIEEGGSDVLYKFE